MERMLLKNTVFILYRNTLLPLSKKQLSYSKNVILNELLYTMRKQSNNSEFVLKHLKYKEKSKSLTAPSIIYLQVLGNGSLGCPKSLFLFSNFNRYLFNCGEGTQRLATEHGAKISRLEHLFFTHSSWENIGGLPGMILTLRDIGVPKIVIHGPPNIEKLFIMTKAFMKTKDVQIEKKNYTDECFTDDVMTVKYVPLFGGARQVSAVNVLENESSAEDYYAHESGEKKTMEKIQMEGKDLNPERQKEDHKHVTSETVVDSTAAKRIRLSPELTQDISVAFICKPHKKQGQLDFEKCVEFKVPPGPLLGKLKNGEDVTLKDGSIIRSKDVTGPEQPGPVFIVVDCPNEDFLDSLLQSKEFENHQAGGSEENIAKIVVHFSPSSVIQSSKYQEWISRFSSATSHLLINDQNSAPCNMEPFRMQAKLSLLHDKIFPLLPQRLAQDGDTETTASENDANESKMQHSSSLSLSSTDFIYGDPLLKFCLRPKCVIDRSACVKIDNKTFVAEAMKTIGVREGIEQLKDKLGSHQTEQRKLYPEILFLGTGSCIPNKNRNVSSTLLNLSKSKSLLLDCGEGTVGQLCRFYGDRVDDVLRSISAVFISHLHADHHLGLIQLLKKRQHLGLQPLYVIAPYQLMHFLRPYSSKIESVKDMFELIPTLELVDEATAPSGSCSKLREVLQLKKFEAVPVIHCIHSFACVVTHEDGWKVAYSGDTMPCTAFVKAGKDCDILIHEATLEDDLVAEARMKAHSTTSQAIAVGKAMNAKFTILSHFSQRYAKIPLFTRDLSSHVGIAFDNMRVIPQYLSALPHFPEVLQVMFAEHYADMETKRLQRQVAKEYEKEKSSGGHYKALFQPDVPKVEADADELTKTLAANNSPLAIESS